MSCLGFCIIPASNKYGLFTEALSCGYLRNERTAKCITVRILPYQRFVNLLFTLV